MKFKKLWDLINFSGPMLSIVESKDEQERLYIKARVVTDYCKSNLNGYIYAPINDTTLEMFFQSRISVKELFLLRKDENFIVEFNSKRDNVFSDEEFEFRIINHIKFANSHWHTLHSFSKCHEPFDDILKVVKRDYMNGIGIGGSEMLFGATYLKNLSK